MLPLAALSGTTLGAAVVYALKKPPSDLRFKTPPHSSLVVWASLSTENLSV